MISLSADTIAAPITAPGHSAVALVRVSGSLCEDIIHRLCGNPERVLSNPREAVYCAIFDRLALSEDLANLSVLDWGLAVYFPAPRSFTGEDCLEFNLHGSPYLVEKLLENLVACGVRLARPGEFSERAFLNGQIDLSQAEAIADLIAAETASQARVAKEQLEGRLSQALAELGEPLRNLLAEIEAHIDFPEEDIDPLTSAGWKKILEQTERMIANYVDSFAAGRIHREGARVVLAGLPNAGKSSLLNLFVGEERAIVTPIAGTTRDSIEERVSIDGLYVRFCDTAGLADETSTHRPDTVEVLGIERSWKRIAQADLVLYIVDGTASFEGEKALYKRVASEARKLVLIVNKLDLLNAAKESTLKSELRAATGHTPIFISALTRDGLAALRERLLTELLGGEKVNQSAVVVTNQRHFEALKTAALALADALLAISKTLAPEFVALHIRESLNALNDIVGVTYTEDILGRIFSKFCIGK